MNDLTIDLPLHRQLPKAVAENHKGLGPPVGLWSGVDETEYHEGPGLGSTDVKQLMRSPAHFKAYRAQEHTETPAKLMGSALHIGILQPWLFDHMVVQGLPLQRRSAKDKAAWAEFELEHLGKLIVPHASWDHLHAVIENVAAHPLASTLLTMGEPEVTMYWVDDASVEQHEPTYRLCKGRVDWLDSIGHNIAIDLKSTEDASYTAFLRSAFRYNYHLQAAHYLNGLQRVGSAVDAFVFVAFEKTPPYAVACYELDDELLRLGRLQLAHALTTYHQCTKANEWPAYAMEIRELEPLPYMKRMDVM